MSISATPTVNPAKPSRQQWTVAQCPDYLVAANDVGLGGATMKLADAAQVSMILLSNDLDLNQWTENGERRTKCRQRLGGIVLDHEGDGHGIAEALLAEATRITTRPLKLLALAETPNTSQRRAHPRPRRSIGPKSTSPGSARVAIPAAYPDAGLSKPNAIH
jgi:hypothetical protein